MPSVLFLKTELYCGFGAEPHAEGVRATHDAPRRRTSKAHAAGVQSETVHEGVAGCRE